MARFASVLVALVCLSGCFPLRAQSALSAAERSVARAAEAGADRLAPYEYHLAREHLAQARIEDGEAEYDDAIEYARSAERYAARAEALAKAAAKAQRP